MKSLFLFGILLLSLAVLSFVTVPMIAQSRVSGDITGTITDPSGAAVPNASVTLKNLGTGATETTTSNSTGAYRFGLLNPGSYSVAVTAQGFQPGQHNTQVVVGQGSVINIALQVAGATQTVEVSAEGGVIQTENGNVTDAISPEIVSSIPNPGNDLTYYVQTAPGATMNTQGGYGNTSMYGISATSNLFTVDGMDENDPFLNVNNSGATNLLLGSNDIQTASVVTNGYSGEYGTLAGANVNYVTKSGTNKFHGNAEYFWNGETLDANDWFLNNQGAPRSFVNANQWAASIGGPIRKDKTFFFVDTEGLRLLIPTAQPVFVPSAAFQAYTLASVPASEIPFYNRIFSIYNGAPGISRATPALGGGCSTGFTLPTGGACADQFESNVHNQTNEWLLTTRVDQNFGNRDRAFVHFRTDHGLQATTTDVFNPILNAQSIQPQYEGQLQETHQVGANAVNQLIVAGSWYSAVFAPSNLSAATSLMPYDLFFADETLTSPGSPTPGTITYSSWPQGRNVTQYQISDDYGWQKGAHDLKFGVNFRRNDITDYTPGGFLGTIPLAVFASQASFAAGTADVYEQAFASRPTQPLAIYTLGFYAQDSWAVKSNLRLTLSLRAEHNSNPICVTNCFSRLAGSFPYISHDPNQPYNQAIFDGQHQAFPSFQGISWEPRVGFAWQPMGQGKTVLRGGFGLFSDVFPGTLATAFDTNPPVKNTFITSGNLLAPGLAGSAQTIATASNSAFLSGFASGLTATQIAAGAPAFAPPTMTTAANNIRYPTYEEWNLQIEQALGTRNSFSLNYVGNHGYDLAATDAGYNAYCDATCTGTLGVSSFIGLPATQPDTRFSTITEAGNYGVSNYNGLTATFTRRVSASFQMQASFTWSHALDDISNGGFLPFNLGTNTAVLTPENPYNFKEFNYGNADYDVRKQANLSYVWQTPKLHNAFLNLLADWTVSGVLFARSGLPFTVVDTSSSAALSSFGYGDTLFADTTVGQVNCSGANKVDTRGPTPACFTSSQFFSAVGPGGVGSFGNERRNQVFGPNFFDTDLTLMKNFRIPHWEGGQFQIGAQAFNILNHPNFDQPVGTLGATNFGYSERTIATPTSIFGSFLGADAAPRALQIRAQLTF